MTTVYTGDGKVLIAWDAGCGPTWADDPEGKPIKAKFLGTCEVWRSTGDEAAVSLGETEAEAFLDDQIANGTVAVYWVMANVGEDAQRQVGPTIDVTLPPASIYADTTPPSPPNELRAKRKSGGNELSWLASSDDESGVLAYLVYAANEEQPDSVIWVDDPLGRPPYGEEEEGADYAPLGEQAPIGTDKARYKWLDRTKEKKKAYIMRAIDGDLNLSEPTGRVDPWTGKPEPEVWPPGTKPPSLVGTVKDRHPVQPVMPEGGLEGVDLNLIGWYTGDVRDMEIQVSALRQLDRREMQWSEVADPVRVTVKWLVTEGNDTPFVNDLSKLCGWDFGGKLDPFGLYEFDFQYAEHRVVGHAAYNYVWGPSGDTQQLGEGPDYGDELHPGRAQINHTVGGHVEWGIMLIPARIYPANVSPFLHPDGVVESSEHLAELQAAWDAECAVETTGFRLVYGANQQLSAGSENPPDGFRSYPNYGSFGSYPRAYGTLCSRNSWTYTPVIYAHRPSYVGQPATEIYAWHSPAAFAAFPAHGDGVVVAEFVAFGMRHCQPFANSYGWDSMTHWRTFSWHRDHDPGEDGQQAPNILIAANYPIYPPTWEDW
jgi:hypothetical protein